MRLLIVEDEKRLADTLRQLLHRQGYTADVSYDGVSGLDNAMSGIYDLVILDVMLPGMNGFQVAQKLRQGGIVVPVLMLTAKSGLTDRIHGLDCGADYSPIPLRRRSCWPVSARCCAGPGAPCRRAIPLHGATCRWSAAPLRWCAVGGMCASAAGNTT